MARSCREASRMFRLALASRCGETTAARIFGREKVRGSLASSSSSSSHHRWYAAPSTKMMAQSHEDDDEWETVVGLELHVQLAADTKLFSGAERLYGAKANANVAPFDAALPGSLPALNARAVELAARLGFALGSQVQSKSSFDRKHYHYPDLPHGYQITQQRSPIALGGQIEVFVDTKEGGTKDDSKGKNHTAEQTPRTLRVERLQLEMDTGKRTGSSRGTLVDLNRAGSTLVEIVTAPDLRGAEEAAAAAETFQQIVRFLGVGDADMELGELRVDVNVSHRRVDGSVVGDRCEVKNLNSFRSITRAIRHERTRQIALMRSGAVVPRQTRSFDPIAGTTKVLRDKEALLDYRFAPEPDLPHVVLEPATLEMIRSAVPELPSRARVRLMDQYGLTSALAARVASHKSSVAYFDECVSSANTRANENGVMPPGAADVANWVTGTLVGAAKKANVAGHKEPLLGLPESADADRVGTLLASIGGAKNGGFTITARMAKSVLAAMLSGDTRPVPEISKELFYSGDEGASVEAGGEGEGRALAATCADVVGSMPDQVELLRGGKTRLMGLFVGEVMKRTKGRADPRRAAEIIKSLVDQ